VGARAPGQARRAHHIAGGPPARAGPPQPGGAGPTRAATTAAALAPWAAKAATADPGLFWSARLHRRLARAGQQPSAGTLGAVLAVLHIYSAGPICGLVSLPAELWLKVLGCPHFGGGSAAPPSPLTLLAAPLPRLRPRLSNER